MVERVDIMFAARFAELEDIRLSCYLSVCNIKLRHSRRQFRTLYMTICITFAFPFKLGPPLLLFLDKIN